MAFGALRFALPLYGLLALLPRRKFRRGKRLLFFGAERALVISFPVAPPESGRFVQMGDIRAVQLAGFTVCGAAVKIAVSKNFFRNKAMLTKHIMESVEKIIHGLLLPYRRFQ